MAALPSRGAWLGQPSGRHTSQGAYPAIRAASALLKPILCAVLERTTRHVGWQ